MKRYRTIVHDTFAFVAFVAFLLASTLLTLGCSSVSVAEQRLVSKRNMLFAESSVFSDSPSFHSIVEPGTAGSGGGQAGGCTSCK